ncbi:carbon catabolite repressor protein 4 homolog 6 [Argentina anserina]|uniref:carbon catabolite repressor protein 4 homolog 6 n=1 Tax=Argentina anserina TaxID=57926 RepID=UPI002176340B|nr:carbon catabolite repressor protein 4 homolog 6 [Potentilla anserina]
MLQSMKRPPPSLQYVVVSAARATAMSTRPPFRGGRNQSRRGYSNRPFSGGDRPQYVTGDSHIRSVQDANLTFRQGDTGSYNSPTGHHRPRPQFTQNNNFRRTPPPSSYNNQPYRPHQQFRPPQQRPQKPLDYRSWEYAKATPPPNSEKFTVISYNILADYLANDHRSKLYYHIPRHMMDWQWRKKNLLFELGLWSADIMCLQEVDRFQELVDELTPRGYSGVWKMRTGNPLDGCAVFWRSSRFKLLHEECIEFNKLGLRDNVAQICVLESLRQTSKGNNASLPTSSPGSHKVVICNIHVLYNPRRGEIKLGQVRVLLEKARAVSKFWNNAPIVLCGDYNCTPKSPLYNFISEQKLDLSEVDRDKVSGQASAEIGPPRSFNPSYRGQHAHNFVQGSPKAEVKDAASKLNDLTSDSQNQNNPELGVGDTPLMENVFYPQLSNTGDISDKSYIDVPHEKNDGGFNAQESNETKKNAVNFSTVEVGSAFNVQDDGSEEDSSTPYSEGDLSANLNDGIHAHSPSVSSHSEKVNSDVTEIGYKDSMEHTSDSYDDPNACVETESMNCGVPELSCTKDNVTTGDGCNSDYADPFNSKSPLSEVSGQVAFADAIESPTLGNLGPLPSKDDSVVEQDNASAQHTVNIFCKSTSVDLEVQKKMENLSLTELDEDIPGNENTADDDIAFLSASHNTGDGFTSIASDLPMDMFPASTDRIDDSLSSGLYSETVGMEECTYDPALWTPMEIEIATGNGECTLLEHPLKLRSTYTEVEDCNRTRDSSGEPLVTSYNRCFFGTVDYIWRSEGLQTVRVLAPIPKHAMQWTSGFPTRKWGSDHIALATELVFTKCSDQS